MTPSRVADRSNPERKSSEGRRFTRLPAPTVQKPLTMSTRTRPTVLPASAARCRTSSSPPNGTANLNDSIALVSVPILSLNLCLSDLRLAASLFGQGEEDVQSRERRKREISSPLQAASVTSGSESGHLP